MSSKILTVILFFLAGFAFWSYMSEPDSDKEICRNILADAASKMGRIDIVEEQISKSRIPYLRRDLNTSLLIANYFSTAEKLPKGSLEELEKNCDKDKFDAIVLSDKFDSNLSLSATDIKDIMRLNSIKNPFWRSYALCSLASLNLRQSNTLAAKSNFATAKKMLLRNPRAKVEAESAMIKCAQTAMELSDAESFIEILASMNSSTPKFMQIYDALSHPEFVKKLAKLKEPKELKKYAELNLPIQYINTISTNAKNLNIDFLEKNFPYACLSFAIDWRIKNWQDMNYPLLSYATSKVGRNDLSEAFKKLSLSKKQNENMKAGYLSYMPYAASIFANMGDWQYAIDCIKSLPFDSQRFTYLKFVLPYIAKNPDSLESVSELF